MKTSKIIFGLAVAAALAAGGYTVTAVAQSGPGYSYGPGMMDGYGPGYGPGYDHMRGYGPGYHMRGYDRDRDDDQGRGYGPGYHMRGWGGGYGPGMMGGGYGHGYGMMGW
jgi:hypothetical protein